jgi:hypothetical protein
MQREQGSQQQQGKRIGDRTNATTEITDLDEATAWAWQTGDSPVDERLLASLDAESLPTPTSQFGLRLADAVQSCTANKRPTWRPALLSCQALRVICAILR